MTFRQIQIALLAICLGGLPIVVSAQSSSDVHTNEGLRKLAAEDKGGQDWVKQFFDEEGESPEEAAQARIRAAQTLLQQQGYDPGPADGQMGPQTAGAVRSYQRDWQLPESGKVDVDLITRLEGRHPSTQPQFYPIENRDCDVWNFKPQARERVTWTGGCEGGKASGQGTLTFRHVQHGKPVETETYEGSMLAGRAHGKGEVRTAAGYHYVGDFKEGRKHGKGIEQFANGARFEGHFAHGVSQGEGTIRWAGGLTITGDWKDGQPVKGDIHDPEGHHYRGGIDDYRPHGPGKLTMADGRVFEGEFRDGKYAGEQAVQTAKRPEPVKPASAPLPPSDLPRIRELLRDWGYRPGDSEAGLTAAIRAYQRDWQLQETGIANADLLARLEREHPATRPQWYPIANQNCQFWNFSPHPQEKVTWTGGCANGKTSGTGVLTFKHLRDGEPIDFATYSGEHQSGLAHGQGDYSRWDGFRYSGGHQNGRPHGRGESEWPDGVRYVGDFKDGERSGRGKLRYADGGSYDGQFMADKRHGKGEFRWGASTQWAGDRYVGDWQNDKRSGQGEYFRANGDRYIGSFVDGSLTGQGELIAANGVHYVGHFRDYKYDGKGVLKFPHGEIYEGDFKDGNQHGYGVVRFSDGTWYDGHHHNGKWHGTGTLYGPNGKIFSGSYVNGVIGPTGELFMDDGKRYVGEFKNGIIEGKGTFYFPDGNRYVGEFVNFKRHGYGTFWFASGDWCAGQFQFNRLVGWSTGVHSGRTMKCRHDGSTFTFFD